MNKKAIATLISVGAAVSMLAGMVLAVQPFTSEQARDVAKSYLPADSVHTKTKDEGIKYEIKFLSADKQERFEIDISKSTQKILSFDSERLNSRGGKSAALNKEQITKIVNTELTGAQVLSVKLEKDDGYLEYEAAFKADSYYGEMTIHPETGMILKRDIKIGKQPKKSTLDGFISYEQAEKLAQKQIPSGIMTDIDLEKENGIYYYEVEFRLNGEDYDIQIDAVNGNLLWSEYTNVTSNSGNAAYIGLERAQQIALAKAPGATVKKCKLDRDDGQVVYEGELRKGNWEYDFTIDAVTGRILEWEEDYDD